VTTAASTPITVVTIEDQRDIREGLAALIDFTGGFRCIGRYRSVEDALAGLIDATPDVVLLDIELPGMSGIEAVPVLLAKCPRTLILMLTVYDDNDRVFEALCAGACGYLLKNTAPDKLMSSLKEAVAGGAPMSPEVARRVVNVFREMRPPRDADYDLTPHEVRLLKLMGEGHSYRTAGDVLGVTAHTVSFHLRRIYEKLQVHTKSEAIAKALKGGLL
jgi:DNA-binding NarL/FixJ family response regulator